VVGYISTIMLTDHVAGFIY